MGKRTPKWVTLILYAIWLAVVLGAAGLAIARREQYGLNTYTVVVLAVVMLALFGIALLPARIQSRNAVDKLSKLGTVLLIAGALVVLVSTLVQGFRRLGLFGNAVLLLFILTFARILWDYVKHITKPGARSD